MSTTSSVGPPTGASGRRSRQGSNSTKATHRQQRSETVDSYSVGEEGEFSDDLRSLGRVKTTTKGFVSTHIGDTSSDGVDATSDAGSVVIGTRYLYSSQTVFDGQRQTGRGRPSGNGSAVRSFGEKAKHWFRKANNAHLKFMENHRVATVLISLTVVGGLVNAIGWAVRDRSFGAAGSARHSNRGRFFIEKQYFTARSGLFAANAFIGTEKPFLSPKDLEVAYRQSRKLRIDNGTSPSEIPAEGWFRGYSPETIRQAYKNKEMSSSHQRIVKNPTTDSGARGLPLTALDDSLDDADRVMVRTNKTGGATDGHWVCFRKDGDDDDSSWVLLDSAKKFNDLARGSHKRQGPSSYIQGAFGKGDRYCDVIMTRLSATRPVLDNRKECKNLLEILTRDKVFASGLKKLPRQNARYYNNLLATASNFVEGALELNYQEWKALSKKLYTLAEAVKTESAFSPDHYNQTRVLAKAFKELAPEPRSGSSHVSAAETFAYIKDQLDAIDEHAEAGKILVFTHSIRRRLEVARKEGIDEETIDSLIGSLNCLEWWVPETDVTLRLIKAMTRDDVLARCDKMTAALGKLRAESIKRSLQLGKEVDGISLLEEDDSDFSLASAPPDKLDTWS